MSGQTAVPFGHDDVHVVIALFSVVVVVLPVLPEADVLEVLDEVFYEEDAGYC